MTTKGTNRMIEGATLNIRDYGVIGDGIADDTAAIREALHQVKVTGKNLVGDKMKCRVSDTIYIPNLGNNTEFLSLDFKGMHLLVDDSVTNAVEMGRYDSRTNTWYSTMNEPVDTYISQGVTLSNLTVSWASPENKTGKTGFGFKNYNTACKLVNLTALNSELGFDIYRCFYLALDTCQATDSDLISDDYTGTGFVFRNENNLMDIYKCLAAGKDRGYQFRGAVVGTTMRSCSFERQNYAIYAESDGFIYGLSVKDCYMEKVRGPYAFYMDGTVNNVTFDNNWFAPLSGESQPNPNIVMVYSRSNNDSRIKWNKSNHLNVIPTTQIFDGGFSFDTMALPTSNITSDNLLLREAEYGIGNVVERYSVNRTATKTTWAAKGVNEIIPSYYSGRRTVGKVQGFEYGLWNPTPNTGQGWITFDTQVLYSSTGLLLFIAQVADIGTTNFYEGMFWGNEFRNKDGTLNTDVALLPSTGPGGTVQIRISGLPIGSGYTVQGAELRIL